jgi:hypothetical protein
VRWQVTGDGPLDFVTGLIAALAGLAAAGRGSAL